MNGMLRASVLTSAMLAVGCATRPLSPPTGAEMFATHCASCHGVAGEGDGPVAAVLAVTAPNLRTLRQRNGGDFPADTVAAYIDGRRLPASHGDRLMPIWGDVFDTTARIVPGADSADMRIAAIVDYLEELQY